MSDAAQDGAARAWSFDELVRAGISLIPAYAPQWTNHNASDPGITLLELLAYFSEILAYRALRITPDAKLNFLRLLEGRTVSPSDALLGAPSQRIDLAIRACVEDLSHIRCAVTPGDFERAAVEAAVAHRHGRRGLHAKCVPGIDLRGVRNARQPVAADAPADVSVVLALHHEVPGDAADELCRHVQEALAPRCLLTTRAHVVRAAHLRVSVACRVAPMTGISLSAAIKAVDAALRRRFERMLSDEPIGRPLHLPTIAATIDRTDEVDYVESIVVRRIVTDGAIDDEEWSVGIRVGVISRVGLDTRLGGLVSVGMRRFHTDHTGEAETVLVHPWEMVQVQLAHDAVQLVGDDDAAADTGDRRRG